MRRMWAAGAAIVMCLALGGLSGAVVAQEVAVGSPTIPTGPAIVTGTVNCQLDPCDHHDVSDPRVSGDAHVTTEFGAGGNVAWGTMTINGPEGDWVGPWVGVWNEDLGKFSLLYSSEGTGAYEGWAFVTTYWEPGGPAEVNGVIYEGDAPRMEWPEPSASPASG